MTGITYFRRPDVSGQFFICTAYRATLSVSACAARYQNSKSRPNPELDPFALCRGCPIGAAHAGETPIARHSPHCAEFLDADRCARCWKRSLRRLIRGLCISCYNRGREFLAGRNSKGTRPTPHLAERRLGVWVNPEKPDTARYFVVKGITKNAAELPAQIMRAVPGPVAFSFPLDRPPISIPKLARLFSTDTRLKRGKFNRGQSRQKPDPRIMATLSMKRTERAYYAAGRALIVFLHGGEIGTLRVTVDPEMKILDPGAAASRLERSEPGDRREAILRDLIPMLGGIAAEQNSYGWVTPELKPDARWVGAPEAHDLARCLANGADPAPIIQFLWQYSVAMVTNRDAWRITEKLAQLLIERGEVAGL